MAEVDILFFNRMEKVGSQSMSAFLTTLSKINDFIPHRNAQYQFKKIIETPEEVQEFAEELINLPEASSYVEHTNWINFTKLELPRPIYMNLIRHPIQKVMSAYYYLRSPAIYANRIKRYPFMPLEKKEYFETSFNDCVKKQIKPYCVFDSHIQYNADWRRFSLHFCGNDPVCK